MTISLVIESHPQDSFPQLRKDAKIYAFELLINSCPISQILYIGHQQIDIEMYRVECEIVFICIRLALHHGYLKGIVQTTYERGLPLKVEFDS